MGAAIKRVSQMMSSGKGLLILFCNGQRTEICLLVKSENSMRYAILRLSGDHYGRAFLSKKSSF